MGVLRREEQDEMNIVGELVILRALEEQDNKVLLELINDPETEKMIGGYSYPVSRERQISWFRGLSGHADFHTLRCMIADRQEPETAVGTVILSDIETKNGTAQIHIKLAKTARGKGYGWDAVNTIVNYGFKELRLNCIYSIIVEYNRASQRLFEKCGFIQEGRLRSRVFKNGQYRDVLSYSILQDRPDAEAVNK